MVAGKLTHTDKVQRRLAVARNGQAIASVAVRQIRAAMGVNADTPTPYS